MKTPVLFIIFNRPETTKKVFEKIKQIKPEKLFISADGPRKEKINEIKICEETRKITEQIDWPCEIFRDYSETNFGCHVFVPKAISWFFENVENGIILEDDCLFDESFFPYCKELLEKYKDENNIMMISGDNFQNYEEKPENSYYFSKYANIWGWASWKRSWVNFYQDFSILDNNRMKEKIRSSFSTKKEINYWFGFYKKIKKGKINNWDAKWFLSIIYNDGICITPTKNLVKNIGFGKDATQTKDDCGLQIEIENFDKIIHPDKIEIDEKADQYIFLKIYKTFFLKRVYNKVIKWIKK
jgi:hypothetical protein